MLDKALGHTGLIKIEPEAMGFTRTKGLDTYILIWKYINFSHTHTQANVNRFWVCIGCVDNQCSLIQPHIHIHTLSCVHSMHSFLLVDTCLILEINL
jgi:hypothetical protein